MDSVYGPTGKQVVFVVGPVINHHRAGLEGKGPGHFDLMGFAVRDHTEAGEIPFAVQNQVQLDGPFGAAELDPIKNTHA